MAIEVAMVGSDPKEVLCDESIKWEQMTDTRRVSRDRMGVITAEWFLSMNDMCLFEARMSGAVD